MVKKELTLQKRVHKMMSDPSKVFTTLSGKRLQFLSPGYLNKDKGPDFRNVAILLNGTIIVCDCEFHINASDWNLHNHSSEQEYSKVGLHIVINNNSTINNNIETLVVILDDLPEEDYDKLPIEPNELISSLEEIQNYALLRLLRRTSESKILIEEMGLTKAFEISLRNFLFKYSSKKHRPVYNNKELEELIDKIKTSNWLDFLYGIQNDQQIGISETLFKLMKTRIHNEGNHLRREILLNCLLPISLAIANEEQRISLFVWFWSTPAINSYGILTRKFKNIPQNFIWQQQGMLEILNSIGKRTKITNNQYLKIGEVLNFFYIGKPTFM